MIVENEFIGFEIKSDSDTYDRLERQVADYNNYCDKNFVVVGKTHEKHVEEHIPEFWGILSVYEEGGAVVVKELKSATKSPKAELKHQIQLLWRPELANIQELKELPKYKGKSKKCVQEMIMDRLDENELKALIIKELFERDYELIARKITDYRAENNQKRRNKVSGKKAAKRARRAMK